MNGKVDAETNGNVKGDGKKPVASIFGQKSVKSTSQSATSSASASGKASTSKVKELDDDQENDADNAKTKASDSESTSTETEDSESDSELDGDIAADMLVSPLWLYRCALCIRLTQLIEPIKL